MDSRITDEDMIFDRINYLLEGLELPFDIRDINDLEKFLNNESNKGFGVYQEIRTLYTRLMNGIG